MLEISKLPKLILLLIISTVIADKEPSKSEEYIEASTKACLESSQVEPEIHQKLLRNAVFTNDPKLKCFIKCMVVKMGSMSETGEVNLDAIKKSLIDDKFPPDQANKVVDKCKPSASEKDPCEIAFSISKCITEGTMTVNPATSA